MLMSSLLVVSIIIKDELASSFFWLSFTDLHTAAAVTRLLFIPVLLSLSLCLSTQPVSRQVCCELVLCKIQFDLKSVFMASLTEAPEGPGDPGVPDSPRGPWAPSGPRAPVGPASPWIAPQNEKERVNSMNL